MIFVQDAPNTAAPWFREQLPLKLREGTMKYLTLILTLFLVHCVWAYQPNLQIAELYSNPTPASQNPFDHPYVPKQLITGNDNWSRSYTVHSGMDTTPTQNTGTDINHKSAFPASVPGTQR